MKMTYQFKVTFVRWFMDRNGDYDYEEHEEYFPTEKMAERFVEVNKGNKVCNFSKHKITQLNLGEFRTANNITSCNGL